MPRFAKLPDVYKRRVFMESIEEWSLCTAWACMLDVAYLLPEYDRLRDTIVQMQWRDNDGRDYE